MRERILCVVAVLGALGLTACGSSGSLAPKLIFNNLQAAQQVHAGDGVTIQYVTWDDDGPDLPASTSFFADVDGDLTTTGDQVTIALNRTNQDGVNMTFNWDTGGVPPGVYNIVALTVDQQFIVQTTAPGKVTVFSFAITKPTANQNRNVLERATVNIDFTYVDPDSAPTVDAYADRDGNLGTTGDQYLIAEDVAATGTSQTIPWNTAGVEAGTYFLVLTTDDGAQGARQFTAGGRVTVITVIAFAPANDTVLVSTAYNARITFSHSLTLLGATINANTVVVIAEESGTIPGTYTLENNGTEINFQPTAGMFPANDEFGIDVRTGMLFSDAADTASRFMSFRTSISPIFVTVRQNNIISVVVADGENAEKVDQLNLDESDRPHYAVCASDGMMYLSQYEGNPSAYVIAFDLLSSTRTTIPLPAVLGEFNITSASGLALSPDEKTLYCAGYELTGFEPNETRPFLSVIDRATMTETKRIQLNLPGWPRAVAVSPDGKRVYVANLYGGYVDTNTGGEGDPFFEAHLGAVHVIDATTNTEIDTDGVVGNGITPLVPNARYAISVAVSADSETLYVGHGGGEGALEAGALNANISVFNTETFVEGLPLWSDVGAYFTAPNIVFDQQRNLLYAPRSQVEDGEGLSVFDPGQPQETIVGDFPGGVIRDVDLLWGTPWIVVPSNVGGGGVLIVDVDTLQIVAGAGVNFTGAGDVATIPPRRY